MHFIRRPYFPLKYTEKLSFEVHSVTDFGRLCSVIGKYVELFFLKIYQLSVRAKGSLLSDRLQTNIQNQHTLLALVFFCVLNLPSVILSRSGSTVQWFAQSPNKSPV